MAKLTDIEQLRRRRARQKLLRNLFIMGLLGAIVLTVSAIVGNLGRSELKAAVSDIRAEIGSGNGFPVPLPGGRFVGMTAASDTLLLQTDTNLYTYNDTGRQMLAYQHGMTNMVLAPARDRILAYDRGGTKVQLLSRSTLLQTMDCKFTIYDADLSERGTFALASGSDSYLAQVSVYDSAMENIFNWYSAERPVISVSLSNQRDAMVVGCVDVKDGSYQSDIQRFQFNMDKELSRAELKAGELLLSLDYHSPTGIRAITDSRVVLLNADLKEQEEYRFEGKRLQRFEFLPDGRVMLSLQSVTGEKGSMLTLLKPDLSVAASFQIPRGLLEMTADGEYIFLTDREKIRICRMDGSEVAVVIASGLHGAQPVGGQLYYATAADLVCENIKEITSGEAKKTPSIKDSGSSSSSGKSSSSKSSSGESSNENALPDDGGEQTEGVDDAEETKAKENDPKEVKDPDEPESKPVADEESVLRVELKNTAKE